MTTRTRLLLAALTATLAMALAVGAAAALRSLSINRHPLSVSSPELTFTTGETRYICAITLAPSLSSVIPKREGVLMGHVEGRVTVPSKRCRDSVGTGVTVTILNETTWRLFFKSFLGTLPRITGILFTIEPFEVLVNIGGLAFCLYRGSMPVLARLNASGEIEELRPLRNSVPLFRDLGGIVGCRADSEFSGTCTPSTRPRVTLL